MLSIFSRRLPAQRDILLAISTASFLIFSWELRALFYNLPAFVLSYSVGEILSIAAYMLAFALLETLAMTLLLVALAFLLPGMLLKDGFAYKASFFFIAFAVISIHLQLVMNNQPQIRFLLVELGFGLALWLIPALLTRYITAIRKVVLEVLDRLTIFSYIYLPLGALSLIVVIARLMW